MSESEAFFSRTDLLSKGWTSTFIKRFLPAPIEEMRYSRIHGSYKVHLWSQAVIENLTPEAQEYLARLAARRVATSDNDCPLELPLLDATCEASRSAHRWRDKANNAWNAERKKYAATCRSNKEHWYRLKELGIIAMHKAGTLRYAGKSPQGMAVYEYSGGGLKCLHSTLHPDGVERVLIENHPELLLVPAKKQRHRLMDVEYTLSFLPDDLGGYSRSAPPRFERQQPICHLCGEEGHIARDCSRPDMEDYLSRSIEEQRAQEQAVFLLRSQTDELEILRNNVKRLVLDGTPFLDAVEFSTDDPVKQLLVYDRVQGWYLNLHREELCHQLRGADGRPDHERIKIRLDQLTSQMTRDKILLSRRS